MTKDSEDPVIKTLVDELYNPVIKRVELDSDYNGCASVVCYQITQSSGIEIPGGTVLKFTITGTVNQNSVKDAGNFDVQTQLLDIAAGTYSNIDHNSW
jgi:hypothetical protein